MIKLLLSIIYLQLGYYNITPTKTEVYDYILSKDILYSDIHMQIICVEVGHLKHINYKNNLCNWRNSDKTYMTFNTWQGSIDYLYEWQCRNYPKYLENHKPTDYWDFIHWVGWVDGKSYSARGKRYIEYCKKIPLNF